MGDSVYHTEGMQTLGVTDCSDKIKGPYRSLDYGDRGPVDDQFGSGTYTTAWPTNYDKTVKFICNNDGQAN